MQLTPSLRRIRSLTAYPICLWRDSWLHVSVVWQLTSCFCDVTAYPMCLCCTSLALNVLWLFTHNVCIVEHHVIGVFYTRSNFVSILWNFTLQTWVVAAYPMSGRCSGSHHSLMASRVSQWVYLVASHSLCLCCKRSLHIPLCKQPLTTDPWVMPWGYQPLTTDQEVIPWGYRPLTTDQEVISWGCRPLTTDQEVMSWGYRPLTTN